MQQQLPADPLRRFVELHESLNAERSWYEDASALRFAAIAAMTAPGSPGEIAAGIRNLDQAVKDAESWMSSMFPQLRMVVASLLYMHGDSARDFLNDVSRGRELFRDAGLRRDRTYELMAILILRSRNERRPIEAAQVNRLQAIWAEMKTHHSWLTGADDYPACAILVQQPGSPKEIGRRTEDIYQALHAAGLTRGQALQTAANVLCLAEEPTDALAKRFADLLQAFRDARLFMMQDDYDELAILSFLDHPTQRIVERVLEHRKTIAELKPRPDKQLSFNLASSIAFLDLVRLDRSLQEVADVKAMLDIQAVVQAQQAAAVSAAATAGAAANSG